MDNPYQAPLAPPTPQRRQEPVGRRLAAIWRGTWLGAARGGLAAFVTWGFLDAITLANDGIDEAFSRPMAGLLLILSVPFAAVGAILGAMVAMGRRLPTRKLRPKDEVGA